MATFFLFVTIANAQSASALNFDGTNDYVAVNNPYRTFNKEITVEFWMNTPSADMPFGSVMGQGTSNVDNMTNNVWLMHPNINGTMTFYVNDAGTWRAAQCNIIAGSWHHYAGVASATSTKIYVDGALVFTGAGISNTILNNSSSVIHIGKDVRYNVGKPFDIPRYGNMSIDEVRIWNRALCQDEIVNNKNCEPNAVLQTGLQEYYRFNQGNVNSNNAGVTTLTDASGNSGRDGTLNNFGLTGLTSNWVASGSTNTGTCAAFVAPTAPITGTTSICIGASTTLANSIAGGTWSSSNTAVATINATTGVVSSVSAGNSTITYKTADCGGVSTVTVTVNALPTFTVCPANQTAGNTAGQCNAVVSYTATATGTPAPTLTYTFSGATSGSGSGTGSGQTFNVGVTNVTVTATNTCGSVNCTFNVTVTAIDSDGDGIPDACDADADNDGIPNVLECNKSNFYWSNPPTVSGNTAAGTINGIGYTYTSSSPIYTTTSMYAHSTFPLSYGVPNANPTIKNLAVTNNTITFASPMTNPVLVFASIGQAGVPVPITFGAPIEIVWSQNVVLNSPTRITGTEGYAIIRMMGTFSSINFNYQVAENWCNFAFGADFQTCGDKDNDGTPDYLDLDSDGDGCPDAIEGTMSFSISQTSGGRLTGAVNSQGIPVLAGNGQGVGTSQTSIVNCFCQPGLDETKPNAITKNITVNLNASGNATITASQVDGGSTDDCGIASITVSTTNFNCSNIGVNTVTLTVTDNQGNVSSATATVTVQDIIAPTFTSPAHIITPVNGAGEVTATGPSGAVVNYAIPSASDNCGPVSVVATPASGSTFVIGATTVTVTATDAYNNSVQTSFVVTVSGLVPQIVCPANIEVNNTPGVCGANVPFAATETYGIPASTITYTEAGQPVTSGSYFTVGTHTITATASNAVGSDVCTFTIIVKDNENPTFTPPVVTGTRTITIPYGQTCCWNSFVYNFTDPLPAGAVVTGIDLSYSGKDQGWGGTGDYNQLFVSGTYIGGNQYQHYTQAYTVNFAGAIPGYVYGGNNTFQMNFTGYPGWQGFFYGGPMTIHYKITSSNTNPPSIAANNNIGQCGAIVPLSIPVTADNCGVASIVNDAPSVFPVGTTTVTWTVTDIHGNKNTTTQSVTVIDNEKPTISIAPVSANNDLGACSATVNIGTPVTGDNCGIASVVNNHASNIYPVGTTTITWTVTDIHGNTNTTTQSIIVTDNEKPTISIAPVSANNGLGACSATVNIGTPTTGDNCGVASVINDHASNIYPVGTTTVTWTVTDIHGNQSTATQTITVTDNETPTITAPANIAVNNDAGVCEATVLIGTPTTGDNCGVASVVNDHASNIYPVGTTTVTWTVTDIHGNQSTATQTITVTDNELPTISIVPVSVNNDLGVCGATVNIGSPVTGDNCGVLNVVNDHASNDYPVGATTVTWTVTDIHSNTNSITQLVTVTDNEKPVITNPSAQVNCANADGSTAYSIPAASATDNCGVASQSYAITGATTRGGTGYDAGGVFNIGVSTITWTVTDVHGNTSTSTTTVTINPLPVASYTTSNADAFCNQLTITASSSITPATYQWFSGSSTFANTQSISLGQTNGDGIYSVKVTDATTGCVSATAATYNFQKQTLASSYTILALEEVELGAYNKVNSGSVGVISPKGEAEFRSNSSVNSPGSFVKAGKIESKGSNILITTPILSAATGITLPTMYYNTASTSGLSNKEVAKNSITTVSGNYKNLTLKKGSRTTLTGTVYGTIKVEQGAQVTFTQTTINIGKLHVVKGPRVGYSYVHFADDTKVLIGESVHIGSQVYINPENNKVTFYLSNKKKGDHGEEAGKGFMIHGGETRVTANIYMPNGKLKVKGGYGYGDYGKGKGDSDKEDDDEKDYGNGNSYVYMTGLFIAREVESEGKNVIWNSFDCSSTPVPLVNTTTVAQSASIKNTEQPTAEEELKVTVMPNPSSTYFTLKLESKYETPVNMRVLDAGGRVIDAKSQIGSNSTFQVGHGYSSGTYFAELLQGSRRKVVQLVKVRG